MKFLKSLSVLSVIVLLMSACSISQPIKVAPVSIATTMQTNAATVESAPIWLSVPVVDAKTGKSFTVNDLKGKVVLVEGMATWCPSCWNQGREIKKLYEQLGKESDLVIISLTLDIKEDSQALNEYAKIANFQWQFVTSTLPMYHDLGNRYGALYLDPTLGPFLLVDRKGIVTHFESGLKTAKELKSIIDPMLNDS
jgi:cytochrome oxidase Cu insertion factor (SCO1/SenC/PrrC family)